MDLNWYKMGKIKRKNLKRSNSFGYYSLVSAVIFFCVSFMTIHVEANNQNIVESWASQLGDELNWLAKNMTKADEIKKQYKENNAKVEDKGELIQDAVKNVGQMFKMKTVAVRCIANKAEELAEEFDKNFTSSTNGTEDAELHRMRKEYKYYSSKYSVINNVSCTNRSETQKQCSSFKILKNADSTYKKMFLQRDKHFYHISVNTTHTSVHVPTNVFDGGNKTKDVLIWSEDLDPVFVKNYKMDPALSWQYFGSETGVLRHFPAKSWEDRDVSATVDVYDCRKRSWYIETATCSKDIVMLLDKSGSMTGYLGFVAKLTIKSLLDTFSNNDFFNIYTYSVNVTPLVDCFGDELVQATPENINVYNEQMTHFKELISGYANETGITMALERAFELLEKYRFERNCSDEQPCNQAIMLITDNIQGNFTDIFDEYNHKHGTPVRIFTYLLGKDQSNVDEMKNIACNNRGAFAHIQTLDEVQEKVLDYVNTIALPLVLQEVKHPPTWTHAFKDVTYRDEETYVPENGKKVENLPPRLMIAVGVPAYKITTKNGTRNYTGLLGVASTDVPVEDIDKLTLPYKLGVNAYPFIVSNNGYVLLHPDLRPIEKFKIKANEKINLPQCQEPNKTECVFLKNNYNSIDLTEVEQIDEIVEERTGNDTDALRPPLGPVVYELRRLSLSHSIEKKLNVNVRFNYDKMRRIAEETYDYYFAPLNSTPFTLGLAIPSTYGQTMIKVGNEIENNKNKGLNMSELFVGQNWKVHPDWVYCKFHYMEYKTFNNSEDELLYFVNSFYNSSWTWSNQYGEDSSQDSGDEEHPNCERETYKIHQHYCNRELVELLVFDARVTNTSYGTWKFDSVKIKNLIDTYNATLRFVATMSGLTRWQFIYGEEVEREDDKEFGDYFNRAIDETWYKSAVLQHKSDNESFVYSVPHDDKDEEKEDGDIKVMASHAIFCVDAGKEAPGCVVGFQFTQQRMFQRFIEITNQVHHPNHNQGQLNCSETHNCYVIDNNGYIILSSSENINHTGRFFGEVEGDTMKALVDEGVFKANTVYDFQAVCKQRQTKVQSSFGTILSTPFQVLKRTLQWIATEIILSMLKINFWAGAGTIVTDADFDMDLNSKNTTDETFDEFELEPCDKVATLYVMQNKFDSPICDEYRTNCFYFSRVKLSNLLLVVVEHKVKENPLVMGAEPRQINYTSNFPCHKTELNRLDHRRLEDCFTQDCREKLMIVCSSSCSYHTIDGLWLFIVWISSMSLVSFNL